MYKLRGQILNKQTEEITTKKGETFEKMFITIEETESDFKHKYQFEIFGEESITLHKNKVKDDRYVNITFYIKANEWKNKFFNTLMIKDIILEDEISYEMNEKTPF